MKMPPSSVLLLTLDSCRHDTFMAAEVPHFRSLGTVHKAMAPSYFTYASHAAMFVGFTPGVAQLQQRYLNPKYGKLFKMQGSGFAGIDPGMFNLQGRSIMEGFRRLGYAVLGTGSAGWFNPDTPTGRLLTEDFDAFYFPENTWSMCRQLEWIESQLSGNGDRPVFLFVNIGETHVPYHHEGAPWSFEDNPCVPFQADDRSEDCRNRQKACLEYVDRHCSGLLATFADATVVVTADHGDCWGEDGLWEHGVSHEKTLTVPLIIKLGELPTAE